MSSTASAWPCQPGDCLPSVTRLVTQERVTGYAHAAGDFNPIHLDAEFARGTQFGRRIAHGMLTFAFVAEMLARAFPETWSNGGRLKVRFKTAVFPDEKVTTFGEVTEIIQTPEGPVAECKVGLRKQDGEEAIAGQAWVRLGPPER